MPFPGLRLLSRTPQPRGFNRPSTAALAARGLTIGGEYPVFIPLRANHREDGSPANTSPGPDDFYVDRVSQTLRNVAFMTVGPAMGHGFDNDVTTLHTVVAAWQTANASGRARCRITHPELSQGSRDGIMELFGTPLNLRVSGQSVIGDIRVLPAANHSPVLSPNGKFEDWLFGLAEQAPSTFGVSVVCAFDFEDRPGNGQDHPPLARATFFKAADLVDDPAANPTGLLNTPPTHPTTPDSSPPTADTTPGNPNTPGNTPAVQHTPQGQTMNPRQLQFLAAILLTSLTALTRETEAQQQARVKQLNDEQKRILEALAIDDKILRHTCLKGLGRDPEDPTKPLSQWADNDPNRPATPPASPDTPPVTTHATEPVTPQSATAPATPNAPAPATQNTPDAPNTGLNQPAPTTPTPQIPANTPDTDAATTAATTAVLGRLNTLEAAYTALGHEPTNAAALARQRVQQAPHATTQDDQVFTLMNHAQTHQPLSLFRVGRDLSRDGLALGVEDYLATRMGLDLYQEAQRDGNNPSAPITLARGDDGQPIRRDPQGHFNQLAHLSLIEVGRHVLTAMGATNAAYLDPETLLIALSDPSQRARITGSERALAHSSTDFPGLLRNVVDKALIPAYDTTPSTYRAFTQDRIVPDFKNVYFNQVGNASRLRNVAEGAEYEYGSVSEAESMARVYKYGLLFAFTYEMLVNDDLSVFNERVLGFAESARYLEDDEFYGTLLSIPKTADGVALFHSGHANLNQGDGGAADLGKDTLSAMREATAIQTGIAPGTRNEAGRVLNLQVDTLLVPPTQADEAEQLIASRVDPTKSNGTPNFRFINNLNLVVEPRIQIGVTTADGIAHAGSSDAYYTAATRFRSAAPAYRLVARFHPNPRTERQIGFTTDGITFKGRHVWGKHFHDHRAWQKNDGTT
ncbi:MAG: hypothetical protein AAF750_15485 [Planctomycetota bacterium]